MKFFGNIAFITCGNGCNSKMQRATFNQDGEPIDVDWDGLVTIYNNHNANCTPENPYGDDDNAFYGNPDDCTGFKIESDPNSGYKFCEY